MSEVKTTLALLESKAPGRAIEVRIPPYAAIQCGEGPTHTRGTPPNVIEMKADTWLSLAKVSQHGLMKLLMEKLTHQVRAPICPSTYR